jgi:hypothetical protein
MTKHYFVNKQTGRRYEVISTQTIGHVVHVTLKGEFNTFVEPFDKASFKKMGYVLKREDYSAE